MRVGFSKSEQKVNRPLGKFIFASNGKNRPLRSDLSFWLCIHCALGRGNVRQIPSGTERLIEREAEVCGAPPFRDETAKGWGTRLAQDDSFVFYASFSDRAQDVTEPQVLRLPIRFAQGRSG